MQSLMIVKVEVEATGIKDLCWLMSLCTTGLLTDRCHLAIVEVVTASSTLLDPSVKLLPTCLTVQKMDLHKTKVK